MTFTARRNRQLRVDDFGRNRVLVSPLALCGTGVGVPLFSPNYILRPGYYIAGAEEFAVGLLSTNLIRSPAFLSIRIACSPAGGERI